MKVSTINLSPKLDEISPEHGTINRGEMSSDSLATLLKEFAGIDPALNHEHDPRIMVQTRSANHAIRTGQGRLQLYNARDNTQPGVELSLPRLIVAIEQGTAAVVEPDPVEPAMNRPAPLRRNYQGPFAAMLLLLGLALNAWGVHLYLNRDPAPPSAAYTAITDEAKLTLIRRKLSGIYATGDESGSRVITLPRDGSITFQLLYRDTDGTIKTAAGTTETCRVGERPNGAICLVTHPGQQISIGVDGSLHHSGDTYRRISHLAK
jgi:hypothetical protein